MWRDPHATSGWSASISSLPRAVGRYTTCTGVVGITWRSSSPSDSSSLSRCARSRSEMQATSRRYSPNRRAPRVQASARGCPQRSARGQPPALAAAAVSPVRWALPGMCGFQVFNLRQVHEVL
jgi:hypothetical protein